MFSQKNQTQRKRHLDFFVFKSVSESPFYQVGEQENPPGSYWTSMTGDLLTFCISDFVHTQSLLKTHLCFCKDIQMHSIHTSRYLCDSWANSSYVQTKWKSKLCWQNPWKGIRWWVRTKSENPFWDITCILRFPFLSYGFVLRCEMLEWHSVADIVVSWDGKNADRKSNWEDKFHRKGLKMVFLH